MSTTPVQIASTNGLCANHDFIRPGEEPLYDQLNDSLFGDLAPAGILEITLVDEIRRAMWRLRRCSLVEENFAATSTDDPMQVESHARLQTSVDRARSQAHRLLHKCTAELRKLQTERIYRNESLAAGTDLSTFGVCDWASIETRLVKNAIGAQRRRKAELETYRAELDAYCNAPSPDVPESGPICKTTQSPAPAIPRAA